MGPIKSKLSIIILAVLTSTYIGACSLLEEKQNSADTSTNTEISAKFETDNTVETKRPIGCYPDIEAEGYDYTYSQLNYKLKITSSDVVQVCLVSHTDNTNSIFENLAAKTIKFYATDTAPTSYGIIVNPSLSFSITALDGSTNFYEVGTGTACSWITTGGSSGSASLVAELDMSKYKDFSTILIVDECDYISGSGMSPYEKSRQLGD